jgi:DNA-binding response OmpR family regulator
MIVIIEHEIHLTNSIKKNLSKSKYKTYATDDYKDGFEYITKNKVDLVIIDIINSCEIINNIKNTKDKIKIIVLSEHIEEETIMNYFKLGADEYMEKPINLNELIIRVKKLLKSN